MPNLIIAPAMLIICLTCNSCGLSAERAAGHEGQEARPAATAQPEGQSKDQPAKPARAPVDPNKFAIVVAGVGGEEPYTKRFASQAAQLYDALTSRLGFDEKRVLVMTETGGGPENGSQDNFAKATAERVRKAFDAVKSAAAPESLVFIVLIGHGSFDSQNAKFNLLGPDLTAKDYAGLIGALPTRRVVVVNCSSSSGEFIKPLSGEGRVVITATRSGNEQNATIFAEHFIAALTNDSADADKNARISVLEAFNYATKQTADWYKQKDRLATEHALIDDNGDGVGHEEAKEGDGTLSKTLFIDSKPMEQAGGDAELARLLGERQRLEESIEKLKARKGEMKQEEYESELERLLVEVAKLTQAIKARQK
jgi:hypothetical protein